MIRFGKGRFDLPDTLDQSPLSLRLATCRHRYVSTSDEPPCSVGYLEQPYCDNDNDAILTSFTLHVQTMDFGGDTLKWISF